ncbi:MAG TPA: prephenate dehydrogenase/arogenate dehydrogenase family protein, partial [Longimicrobiaceae bacterium]|nr:prephenate dehydrogenase/arogenate dehydrogenase family protein [Longimicrobiaceae bacterium]
MKIQSAAVVGLGLIGGSVARDLAALGVRVLGRDRDASAVGAAVEEGVVASALGDDLSGVQDAELVVLALPVSAAAAALRALRPHLGAARLVTDVGSTKRGIIAAAVECDLGDRFVGSHPLAGSEASGWSASREGLFRDAPVYLSPTPATAPPALSLARELWTALGGVHVECRAEQALAGEVEVRRPEPA